ncbi:MAG: DUF1501 domain-containing protein [Planctomycetaceae bacterium]|nr:DUF1501 domain-containing protein [Planctomycetaceae bacterium]
MRPAFSGFCDGVSRRNLIRAGAGGIVGLSLSDLLRLRAASGSEAARSQTSVIYLELAGGPAQHETWDPKPLSPKEYRGPLSAIDTVLPGVQFCEVMAEQAKIADKLIVVRSIGHDSSSHQTSSHLTQTGYYLRSNTNAENEMPCAGSIAAKLRGANAYGMPAFVSMPVRTRYGRPAWLGNSYFPLETKLSANDPKFAVPNLSLLKGVPTDRLKDRTALLAGLDATRRMHDDAGLADSMDQFGRQAFDMVTSGDARAAFDISQEDDATRDRYGRTEFGQNLLLARRLVERGVTFVTVRIASPSWDDHTKIKQGIEKKAPAFDRGVAALISELHERGLDKQVLVVAMGEFGRTPKVNKDAGRDHWGRLMSAMLACGGLQAGMIVGSSDSKGTTPVTSPYRPENVVATMYRHLGIDPSLTFVDSSGRPRYILERREAIAEIV